MHNCRKCQAEISGAYRHKVELCGGCFSNSDADEVCSDCGCDMSDSHKRIGATWGAWVSVRVRDHHSPIPFIPAQRGGVAYETPDVGEDADDESNYRGHAL